TRVSVLYVGSLASVPAPEGLPLPVPTAEPRPQVADRLGAVRTPAPAPALETLAHHRLAGALHRPAADRPPLRHIGGAVPPAPPAPARPPPPRPGGPAPPR